MAHGSCTRTGFPFLIAAAMLIQASGHAGTKPEATEYWQDFGKHLINDVTLLPSPDLIHAVIEIPAGDHAKWEIDTESGKMFHDHKKGKPRYIKYATPYPANYGSIPQTLQGKEQGGDGDPLDVIVPGLRLDRGTIVPCRIIGVMHLTDKDKVDDKLIAVPLEDRFEGISSIEELEKRFPKIKTLLRNFFTHYKLNDKMTVTGFSDADTAEKIVFRAHAAWSHAVPH